MTKSTTCEYMEKTILQVRRYLQSIVLSLLLLPSAHAANAQGGSCQSLKVAFAEHWFPVAFMDSGTSAEIRGVARSLMEELARQHKVTLETVNPIDWPKATAAMDKGEIDVLAGHYWSSKRAEHWLISAPVMNNDVKVFYRNDLTKPLEDKADLANLLGVFPKGATYGNRLDTFIKDELKTRQLRSNNSMLLALVKQRADYAIIAKMDGIAHVRRLGLKHKITMSNFSLAKLNVHFSFSKKSPCQHLFASFDQAAHAYLSEQRLQKMINNASGHYFMLK